MTVRPSTAGGGGPETAPWVGPPWAATSRDRRGRLEPAMAVALTRDAPVPLAVLDASLRTVWANVALLERAGGDPVTDPAGWALERLFPEEAAALRPLARRVSVTGTAAELPLAVRGGTAPGAAGRPHIACFPLLPSPQPGWVGLAIIDRPPGRRWAALVDGLRESERRLAFLLDTASRLADAGSFETALRQLAAAAVPELGDLCLIDVVDEGRRPRRVAAVGAYPGERHLVDALRRDYTVALTGHNPATQALLSGRSTLGPTMSDALLRTTSQDERQYQLYRTLGFRSFMCVPLRHRDDVLGVLTLVTTHSGRSFGLEDLTLARELARHAADVLAASVRYEREHRLAHDLQARLLPGQLPRVDGLQLAVRYLASTQGAEVGGDFYDARLLPGGQLSFAIGDVAGHDLQAAAMMGQLRSAARLATGHSPGPGAAITCLQESWDFLGFDRTATATFGAVDPSTGEVVLAAAGHPPPLLVTRDGARLVHLHPSPPLGAPAAPVQEARLTLTPGSTLLLYTDGLIETRGAGLETGISRVAGAADPAAAADPERLCDLVLASLTTGGTRRDDVAVLALTRL